MTTETKTAPTAQEIDDLCMEFDGAKLAVDEAEQDFSKVKGDLLAKVQDFGYTPANAEKTTRLEGVIYVADATTASTVEMNEASIGELQSELSRLKKPKVFGEIFERKVKHSLKKNAAGTLKLAIGGFDEGTQKRLLGIFACCFKVNSKAPALTVELATALREKESAAAEKAAKAAERAAKKAEREAKKAAKKK
jgi:hypothetical protein